MNDPVPRAAGGDPATRVRKARSREQHRDAQERAERVQETKDFYRDAFGVEVNIASGGVLDPAEVRAAYARLTKVPVHLGDLEGPQGNVFWVIGNCRRAINEAEACGMTVPEACYRVVDQFTGRTYEQTLDLVRERFLDLDGSIDRLRRADLGVPRALTEFPF